MKYSTERILTTHAGALPLGLQVVGDAWDEATVLQVLAHLDGDEAWWRWSDEAFDQESQT